MSLDSADEAVKEFLRSLAVNSEGVELELDGEVLCQVVPTVQLSGIEKKALVEERWSLIQRARKRSRSVPASVIERETQETVEEIRGRSER